MCFQNKRFTIQILPLIQVKHYFFIPFYKNSLKYLTEDIYKNAQHNTARTAKH